MSSIIEKIKSIVLMVGDWIFEVKAVTPKKVVGLNRNPKRKSKKK